MHLPASVQHLRVLVIDGKKIKHVARRLKILRRVRGQVLAAKIVVALDLRTGLALALSAHPDGEASDAPLVPDLLTQVTPQVSGPRLWVQDRLFCDLNQPRRVQALGDHFLIRYNAKVSFQPDPACPRESGQDERGRVYHQEWGWLGSTRDPRRQYVRRITLQRPGEEAVILITDLCDAAAYPACDLLAVYLQCWGIERVFQRITEVFSLRTLIGRTPQAGVFQAAFCLLLYNVLVTLRGYLSEAQQREPETISTAKLFHDVQRQWVALHEVLTSDEIVQALQPRRVGAVLRAYLRGLLATMWRRNWLKAPGSTRRSPRPATEYLKGGHNSVYRLQQAATATHPKGSPHRRQ